MEARELRIGNIIGVKEGSGLRRQGAWRYVNHRIISDIASMNQAEAAKYYEPIPFLPEWLPLFGFEKKEAYGWKGNGQDYQPEDNKTECHDYVLHIREDVDFFVRYTHWGYVPEGEADFVISISVSFHLGRWYEKANHDIECCAVESIHHFQNIVHALTGEELQIKQETPPLT